MTTYKSTTLKPSRNYMDAGTVGKDVQSLAENVQSISDVLDVQNRNTKNVGDSFMRVTEVVSLNWAKLNGKSLVSMVVTFGPFGGVELGAPSKGPTLKLEGLGAGTPALKLDSTAETGANTLTPTWTNYPGPTSTANPVVWIPVDCDGTIVLVPGFAA